MDGESPRYFPLEKPLPLVDFLTRLARDWVSCRNRYERSSSKWKANIAAAERDLKSAITSPEASDKDLHELRKKIYLLKETARRERGGEEFIRRWEGYHQHPFRDVCEWIARNTGSKQKGIQDAAIANFDGYPRLVLRLQQLDLSGRSMAMHRQLFCEHPKLAAKIGLVEADRQPAHLECDGPPLTAETSAPSDARTTPADGLTTEELARLAMVKRKTLLNKLSAARNSEFQGIRPPLTQGDGGSLPDSYSYAAIRPFLLASWPDKYCRFPESFDQAKQILVTCATAD